MRRLALLLTAAAGCATTSMATREAPHCAWRVCVVARETRSGLVYRVANGEPVPATVSLTFRTLQNLRPSGELPARVVLGAGETALVVSLDRMAPDRSIAATPVLEVDLGAEQTVHDESARYRMPFGGDLPRELVQGYGGSESHLGGMRYSLDIAMPEGTPVVAAREGVVLYVQDGFGPGEVSVEFLDRANIVVVAHPDGTMASYGHLRAGVEIRVGQSVIEGDLLGWSGASGLAGQPHLHFHVGRRLLGDPGRTMPVRFVDGEGNLLPLLVGRRYAPTRSSRRRPPDTLLAPAG